MTTEDKINALIEEGGMTREDAIAFLIDCGEIEENE